MARIKIIYRKLGKEQAYGIASSDGIIEIDSRLKSRKHLEVLLHELLHILQPKDSEEMIIKKSEPRPYLRYGVQASIVITVLYIVQ